MNANRISDAEVESLARIAGPMEDSDPAVEAFWAESPFDWIRRKMSGSKGAIFKRLVAQYFAEKGFDVRPAPGRGADRIIGGLRIQIKGATLWSDFQSYRFQQLRDQDHDMVICLGISPFDAHCWVIPKDFLMDNWGVAEGLSSQHLGGDGAETAWLTVRPDSIADWLHDFGGTLERATAVLRSYTSD